MRSDTLIEFQRVLVWLYLKFGRYETFLDRHKRYIVRDIIYFLKVDYNLLWSLFLGTQNILKNIYKLHLFRNKVVNDVFN